MDPTPLSAVRTAVADVTADTAGYAVAAAVADTAGSANDARAALAGAAADTDVAAVDARGALAGSTANTAVAADVAAATTADPAGDLYRRACRVRRHCGLHVRRSARSGCLFWC